MLVKSVPMSSRGCGGVCRREDANSGVTLIPSIDNNPRVALYASCSAAMRVKSVPMSSRGCGEICRREDANSGVTLIPSIDNSPRVAL
ncbi:hypothetical protein TNCV_2226361 [Trichonephila clavipes]|nr:hypothetical protein TNCV_2226361 [Trichonephila clavipes]